MSGASVWAYKGRTAVAGGMAILAAVLHVLINRGFDYIGEAYVLQGSSCSRRRSVGRESGVWIAKASLRSNDHLTVLNDFDDVDRTRGPGQANTSTRGFSSCLPAL